MNLIEKAGLAGLHRLPPEPAHRVSLMAMKAGLVALPGPVATDRLATSIAGMSLLNPLGLAAGYDKDAEAVDALSRAGFGFVEVGAITPLAQPGNPRPRVFRLTEDRAVINRFGFNNQGMEAAAARLRRRTRNHPVPVGLNLGANKDSRDRPGDFARVLATCGPLVDFATVNVSSPNTANLRALQARAALKDLLVRVLEVRETLDKYTPVFLKVAPDLDGDGIEAIVEVAREVRLDGIIATNTTLDREGLKSPHKNENGGLSGPPLFEKSTRVLARLSALTAGNLPLIGVGGVTTAEDAYAKIRAGASAIQLYTALVYGGLSLVGDILAGLDAALARDGFEHVSDAVGTKRGDWL